MKMERKEARSNIERIEAVLNILKKQAPLTVKQEKFCNDACVERFLRAKGDNAKKAAKHLRTVLCWRESIGIEHLIADEFSAELAEGMAYVAGHDEEARPVMVFRIKQEYLKFHSQKMFMRLLVFTLEVATSSMSRFVDQFVLLLDASLFKSASALLNLFMGVLKIISDYYPGRLHKAFVIDPPSLFGYMWKGVRPFVDQLSAVTTTMVSSLDFEEDSLDQDSITFASYPAARTTSLRFDPATKFVDGGSTSSRFSFTVSHLDSLKPWYLSTTTTRTSSSVVPSTTASPSLIGASPLINARSFSFASPAAAVARSTTTPNNNNNNNNRSTRAGCRGGMDNEYYSISRSIPSSITPSSFPAPPTPLNRKQQQQQQPRTPRPSFLQSPAAAMLFSFKKEGGRQQVMSRGERDRDSFLPFLRFYRRPYDEMIYRAKMRPPLGGLISIVSPKQQNRKPIDRQRFSN